MVDMNEVAPHIFSDYSEEQFIEKCRSLEQCWVNTKTLQQAVAQLVDALEEYQPIDTWFYEYPLTFNGLFQLRITLQEAEKLGSRRVRLQIH